MNELTAVKTPVTSEEMFEAMASGWLRVFPDYPSKKSLLLLMAQWGLETGNGSSMWCYNLGNVKATPGGKYDYCYFACNEILPMQVAYRTVGAAPTTSKITKERADGTAIVWFYPKHPACCFRAFSTLEDGVADHLLLIRKRFDKAWPHVISGDPVQYAYALKAQRYFTADVSVYAKGVANVMARLERELGSTQVPEQVTVVAPSATYGESAVVDADDACSVYSPFSTSVFEDTL